MYSGPDRTERLIAGAKKEGVLNVYSSVTIDDMQVAGRRLREEIRRQGAVLARQLRKHPAPRHDRAARRPLRGRRHRDQRRRDGIAASRGHAAGGDARRTSPTSCRRRCARTANGSATGSTSSPPATTPSWSARTSSRSATRTSPIRAGRGGSASKSDDAVWFGALANAMGEDEGHQAVPRHGARSTACRCARATRCSPIWWSRGEVPFALTLYHYKAEQLKNAGAPLDWYVIPPGFARFLGTGVMRRAPHPHAAVLFLDFMLYEAQQLLVDARLHADQHEGPPARRSVQRHRPGADPRPGRQVDEALRRDRREAGGSGR